MKEKFIKSTIILVIGGLITKVLSMVIRILITRSIGVEAVGLYMMVMPTFNLFITIATFSLPISISKLVSENTRNNKNVIFGSCFFAFIYNVVFMLIIVFLSSFIANNLLSNDSLYYPILATAFTLPFITLSSIVRGYFFGKEKMFPHVLSNIFEQTIRIISIIFITPILLKKGIIVTITGLILLNVISELASIFILFLFLPKNFKIKKEDIKPNYDNIKDIISISFPTTIGRLISSFGQFLEPIIITFVFLKLGYDNSYITNQYGIMSGFVLPMVTMPCFLTGAISSALLPVISNYSSKGKTFLVKRKIKQAVFYCLLIGIPCTISLILFPEFFLNLIFGVSTGKEYLKIASLIFLLSYIQGPLVSSLQAMNKAKIVMTSNTIGIILKTLTILVFSFLDIGMMPILLSYLVYYLFNTIYLVYKIKKI